MISVRLPDDVEADVIQAANALGLQKSEFVRQAIDAYLGQTKRAGCNFGRFAELLEYTQVLLQHHVIHDDADKHEAIVSVVDDRLIEHHGR